MKNLQKISLTVTALLIMIVSFAQKKNDEAFFITKYTGKNAIIQYHFAETDLKEKVTVILYRGNEKNEKVKAIHQLINLPVTSDYYFIDSLLPGTGVYLYTVEIVSNNEVAGREVSRLYAFPSGTSASLSSFTVLPKANTNEITLSWKISDNMLAGTVNILRSRSSDGEFSSVASLTNTATGFTDHVNDANEPFFYMLEITDAVNGDFIYSPAVPVVADFEIKPDAPQNLKAGIMNSRPALTWRSEDPLSRGFYVYKKTGGSEGFFQASSFIEQNERGIYKWIDAASSSADYTQYFVFSESNSYTKSNASDTVIIELSPDAKLPAAPSDLHFAVINDQPVQLIWAVDSAYKEYTTGYAVYQKKGGEREYSLLKELPDADQNFMDLSNTATGTSFMVRSKSGDKMSDAGAEILFTDHSVSDFGPQFIKAEIIDDLLVINWQNTGDEIREYRLYKWDGRSYKSDQRFDAGNYTGTVKSYTAGESNRYILKAVNAQGKENEGTKPVMVY